MQHVFVRRGLGQNARSNATSPCTATWYDDTLRSKKLVNSCTSCNSMNENGLREPYRIGRPSMVSR